MSDWTQTERVPATVHFTVGDALSGDLHLQPSTQLHQSVETPLELLNRPDRFLALSTSEDGVVLVSKEHVAVVEVGSEAPGPVWNPTPGAHDIHLEAAMVGGDVFRGTAHVQLPPDRSRPLDFLNLPDRFFALVSEEGVRYLNRAHVVHVRPLD